MSGNRAVLRSSFVLALASVVVLVGLGGSASGAVAGLQLETPSGIVDSANKTSPSGCRDGQLVLGAGGFVGSGDGQVVLHNIRPSADLKSVVVQGLEDEDGTTDTWSLHAIAHCATSPPGLERVAVTSATTSANKSVSAACPTGKRLLGAGGEIIGGGGQVALNDVLPNVALTGVSVSGLEDQNGTTANWSVTAFAICANPVAGLERVAATSASDSSDKFITASCPVGKRAVGAGAELTGGGGEVVLDYIGGTVAPNLAATKAQAKEDEDGTTANWTVRAVAICAAASERVFATSATTSDPKSVAANCPSDMQPTGVGGEITGGGGQVRLALLAPSVGQAIALEDEDGFAGSWAVRAHAICATPPPGLEYVSSVSTSDSASKSVITSCPAGKRVIGVGGEHTGGTQVVLNDIRPNTPDLTSVLARALEDENGFDGTWTVRASAVCANAPPGLELVSTTTDPDSDFTASAPTTCPSGKNVLGTGAEIRKGFGEVGLDDIRPNANLTNNTVTAFEDQNGTSIDWTITSYAICANP